MAQSIDCREFQECVRLAYMTLFGVDGNLSVRL